MLHDLLVIGGGINGAGIARDASGRGLSVALVEAGDIAAETSSASSKLVHGGLRYLEFGAFSLVRKALAERSVVIAQAPHLAKPLPFLIPETKGSRSPLLLRAGLFLYDHLARSTDMPKSAHVNLREIEAGGAFRPDIRRAFRYYDGAVQDARLAIANVRDAARRGAKVVTHTPVTSARRVGNGWEITAGGKTLAGRILVNVGGPFAHDIGERILHLPDPPAVKLVQGAHIVTKCVNRGPDAWLLQQPDKRIVFVIPWEQQFSLIGTTETPVNTPVHPVPRPEEETYLLDAVNRVLTRPLVPGDIVHRFAGIRPLLDEENKGARETSREWKIVHHDPNTFSIIGGKLTTYRLLAEDFLKRAFPETRRWTRGVPLPGGDIPRTADGTPHDDFLLWVAGIRNQYRDYDPTIVERLATQFGTEALPLLDAGLGANLGGLFEAELAFMRDEEWAACADDVLWRHTRLGLVLPEEAKKNIRNFFGE